MTRNQEDVMSDCSRTGAIVLDVQTAFLTDPKLELTLRDAQTRFHLDQTSCREVLGLLADTGVLCVTEHGEYVRYVPRVVSSLAPASRKASGAHSQTTGRAA
jgi:hypothetical protein